MEVVSINLSGFGFSFHQFVFGILIPAASMWMETMFSYRTETVWVQFQERAEKRVEGDAVFLSENRVKSSII